MDKSILYIIPSKLLPTLTPYLNSIKDFSSKGFKVLVLSSYSQKFLDEFKVNNFSVNIGFKEISVEPIENVIKLLKRFFGKIKYYEGFLLFFYFNLISIFKLRNYKKSTLIVTDPITLFFITLYNKIAFSKLNLIYYPQEILDSTTAKGLLLTLLKKMENYGQKNVGFLIEFDDIRLSLREYNSNFCKTIIIPNSQIGEAKIHKNDLFMNKFNIADSKIIVLNTGGIAKYTYTEEILSNALSWSENAVLVMHIWGNESEITQLVNRYRDNSNIKFSLEAVNYYEIDSIYSSADIGLVLYGREDINHKYAGFSSGKLFNFLKNSKPVICFESELYRKYIHEKNCGICINAFDELKAAIDKISQNLFFYQNNCFKEYSFYEFSTNHHKLVKILKNENSF